jgi:hypothetical protein
MIDTEIMKNITYLGLEWMFSKMQFSFSRNVRRKFQLEKNMATYDRSFN